MRLLFYRRNRVPVDDFIDSLPKKDQAKVIGCFNSIEELGFDSSRVEFRQIDGKLWEIKIKSISGGLRIFYVALMTDVIVLLHAYRKKTQKAPSKEIAIARKRLNEVMKDESFYIK